MALAFPVEKELDPPRSQLRPERSSLFIGAETRRHKGRYPSISPALGDPWRELSGRVHMRRRRCARRWPPPSSGATARAPSRAFAARSPCSCLAVRRPATRSDALARAARARRRARPRRRGRGRGGSSHCSRPSSPTPPCCASSASPSRPTRRSGCSRRATSRPPTTTCCCSCTRRRTDGRVRAATAAAAAAAAAARPPPRPPPRPPRLLPHCAPAATDWRPAPRARSRRRRTRQGRGGLRSADGDGRGGRAGRVHRVPLPHGGGRAALPARLRRAARLPRAVHPHVAHSVVQLLPHRPAGPVDELLSAPPAAQGQPAPVTPSGVRDDSCIAPMITAPPCI
jgi:hypothetical protein